jgi:regulator of replication initiation timing
MSKKAWIILVAQFLLFATILGSVIKCSNDKIDRLEHNIGAYKDQIEYVSMQNGELLAHKQSLLLSEEEMREELDMSKQEVRRLKKALDDDIAYIAELESKAELKDTVWMKPDSVVIDNGITSKKFNFSNKWLELHTTVSGNSIEQSKMTLDYLWMNTSLEVGLTDNYTFWAKSNNPYINITDITGVALNNSSVNRKEKRFHHGISVGFGIHYGLVHQKWDFGPGVMYGLTYSF